MLERTLSPEITDEDKVIEKTLRPQCFEEYIGQDSVKENLRVFINAAKVRKECLDHVLLSGPPGLGKTSLANVIAHEMGCNIKITSGPAIERPIDLLVILKNLKPNDILFIDEIHRMSRVVEEVLYPAMEDFFFDRIINKGIGKMARISLPRFTLIGATTRPAALSSPLRDRFGILFHLDFYEYKHLKEIIERSSSILKIQIDDKAAMEIAKRSRGTPRVANRLLKRVRDFAQIKTEGVIDIDIAKFALDKLLIDVYGLDSLDRKILNFIIENYAGGPVGLDTIAAAVGEESDNIEEVYEPYLLKEGFIQKTPRGRKAGRKAYHALGLTPRE